MIEKIRKRVFDAHIHFPIKCDIPYEVLKNEIKKSGITGGLLIFNGREEKEIFWKYKDYLMNGELGFIPRIAFVLDVHSDRWKEDFDILDNSKICYSVKIHPRISDIKMNDFESILSKLVELNSETIIVDNWLFGPRIENHIGTELVIYLAERLPDRKIVMAHAGGVRILESMLLTRPLVNVYYDLSETCSYFKGTSVYMDVIHFIKYTRNRLMFGSDYPDFSINHSIKAMEKELDMAGLSYEEADKIMYATAELVYGGGVIRKIVEECDGAFIEGITRRDDYESILQKMINNAQIIVIKCDEKVAGYASIYVNDIKLKRAYISMFGIKKDYQGKKLGTLLMDKCCEIAVKEGMKAIFCEVLKINQPGYGFYQSYGFRKTKKETEKSFFMTYNLINAKEQGSGWRNDDK